MMLEDEVQAKIRLEAPKQETTLWRNNSGALTDSSGRTVRYGLCNESKKLNDKFKSSDLIGFTEVLITPSMVGKKIAVFTAVEVKREDWTGKLDFRGTAQAAFINYILSKGGFAGFANSVDAFKKIIGR